MRAITYDRHGGADVLQLTDRPLPAVGPDSVLVRVHAAAVNPVDLYVRAGGLAGLLDVQFPVVPGWDVAGIVERVGLDVPELAAGDEVFGYLRKDWVHGGAFAEYVAAPVRTLARKPAFLTFEEAAGVPLAGLTAYQTIRRAGVRAGQVVLVHGASGGVGSFGVQIARTLGARVIGTASERNQQYLRGLGAEPVAHGEGLVGRVRALAPDGVDVVLDYAGHGLVADVPRLLATGGVPVSIVDASVSELPGGIYAWVRPSSSDLADLARLADAGELSVHVDRVLGLEAAAEAHRLLEAGRVRGKVVVRVR
ncbi:NADP-dependent oxidoreductase [Luteimicrobium album]|nr:NADP-dependent oxidoreductase [Luteimicrobium album]